MADKAFLGKDEVFLLQFFIEWLLFKKKIIGCLQIELRVFPYDKLLQCQHVLYDNVMSLQTGKWQAGTISRTPTSSV